MQRDIWFEKMGWSYMPCHWKGFAAMFVIMIPTAIAILAGILALKYFDFRNAAWIPFPIFGIPAAAALRAIAKRTS
jgi:hypothetical protein